MRGETDFQNGRTAEMPVMVQAFLRLCLVAGLCNSFIFFAFVLLRPLPHPPPADIAFPFAFHVIVGLIAAALVLPVALLPYWLALAFVYARNLCAEVLLYVGAVLMTLMALAIAVRSEVGCLAGLLVCLPGIAALICLGQRSARAFLHETMPGFVARTPRY